MQSPLLVGHVHTAGKVKAKVGLVLGRLAWEASLEEGGVVDVATKDRPFVIAAVRVVRQAGMIALAAVEATGRTLVVVTDWVALSRSNFQLCCLGYRHGSVVAAAAEQRSRDQPMGYLCRSDRLLRGQMYM